MKYNQSNQISKIKSRNFESGFVQKKIEKQIETNFY